MVGFNHIPKQMRYQAALLPDAVFPRGFDSGAQSSLGTKRKCAAHRVTLVSTFRDTQNGPASDGNREQGLAHDEGKFANG